MNRNISNRTDADRIIAVPLLIVLTVKMPMPQVIFEVSVSCNRWDK
jgi:hypothetical protein